MVCWANSQINYIMVVYKIITDWYNNIYSTSPPNQMFFFLFGKTRETTPSVLEPLGLWRLRSSTLSRGLPAELRDAEPRRRLLLGADGSAKTVEDLEPQRTTGSAAVTLAQRKKTTRRSRVGWLKQLVESFVFLIVFVPFVIAQTRIRLYLRGLVSFILWRQIALTSISNRYS